MVKYIVLIFMLVASTVFAEPRVRPVTWGTQTIESELDNVYLVDHGVYRSGQPKHSATHDLVSLGIKEILNLRAFHSDEDDIIDPNFVLHRVKMNAGSVTEKQILDSLRIVNDRKGPILIHCWHGADRTGVTIAAYRIVFNNWTKAQALDEMVNGGFGYHAKVYPELVSFIENLDVNKIKTDLNLH